MSLFDLENLTYYYPDAAVPALHSVDLAVEEGEFLLVAGGSGSGKSSLARALTGLIPDFYGGRIGGKVCYQNRDLSSWRRQDLAREIGMVFQDPDKQLVMTGVEAEVAFGLENIGLPQAEMFRRVAEVMSFLNLAALKEEFTATLSGGQKQKLALGSVLAMQPHTLILDEPTSQLAPAAAEEFFNLIKRLNEEMNLTIVLVEQRLDRCFHLADRVVVMEKGAIVQDGPPGAAAVWLIENGIPFVPPVAALFARAGLEEIPLTVKEGRRLLKKIISCGSPLGTGQEPPEIAQQHRLYKDNLPGDSETVNTPAHHPFINVTEVCSSQQQETKQEESKFSQLVNKVIAPAWQQLPTKKPLIEVNNLWFSYPNGREALRDINLSVTPGEFVAILGENAAGKTTLLKQLAGLLKPSRGRVTVMGRDTRRAATHELARHMGYLPQNPNDCLFQETVGEELRFTLANLHLPDDGRVDGLLARLGLAHYKCANPRDLSSGERQRVALAAALVAEPRLLVLDEPTRSIDYGMKAVLGGLLQEIAREGIAVVAVTHDVEFTAEYAGRVVLLFDGKIAFDGPKHAALGSSIFYSPQISRLFRGIDSSVLTLREALDKMLSSDHI
ncbi:MAG: putative HMP/thiamine import ATP-binding protein YkoD [Pelotomaculum sp. PtaB.Bin104]|nr:MAG: putative HMP/thiamine import ATP-binding protein YkoD [Pelotomaculum sp. PtaB.Bin104]